MDLLHLHLSGRFDAAIGSTPLTAFRTAKARALLAYLAVEADTPHPRTSLSHLLWGETADRAAAANFRTTLSNLKKLLAPLPEVLTITRYAVTLHSAYTRVDVVELTRRPSLDTIDLYQGDFLSGFSFSDARPFDEWRIMHQERLHLLALLTLDDLIEREISTGNDRRAIDLARQQLNLEPWHERAHYQLIKLLYQQGQREAAVHQFQQCSRLLEDELGLAPSADLVALMHDIERGAALAVRPAAAQPVELPHNLPKTATIFVGREAELSRLVPRLINRNEAGILTLLGPGGIGKTRLAVEAAGQLLNDHPSVYPDGIFFVSLAPLEDPANIPLAVAEAVGYHVHEEEPLKQQILRFLSARQALLIFDNFEHLRDAGAEFLADLAAAAPRCRFIITSRQKLDLSGEKAIEIHGLATRVAGAGRETAGGEAERLFQLTARRVRGQYDPSPTSMAAVSRICRIVEGNPLAITLAAAWMDSLKAADIAAEIERDIDFLRTERIDIPARQRSLRATFAYSWNLLAAEERFVYSQLSVFRGGFSRQAAQTITGTSIRQLARLVSKSLLTYDPNRSRYAIHEMLRQVSEEKLSELRSGEPGADERTVRDAHSIYYLDAIARREPDFRGEKQQVVIHEIAADFANVRAAWRWGVRHEQIDSLAAALEGLFFFFFMSGREQDGVAEFELALERLPNDRRPPSALALLRARLQNRLFELTHLYRPADDRDIDLLEAIFRHHRAETERALLMNRRAYLAVQRKDVPAAVHFYKQQIPIHEASGDTFRLMATMTSIAQILIVAGQVGPGLQAVEQGLAISRSNGDRLGTALALIILAATDLFWVGEVERARQRFERVEEIGQSIRERGQVITGFVMSKAFLAFIHLISGDQKRAGIYADSARKLWAEKKTPFVNGVVTGINSILALAGGHEVEALEIASRGLAATNRPGAVEFNQIALATAAASQGETGLAGKVTADLWNFILKVQNLPERNLLFYFVPAAAHVLLNAGHAGRAAALLAAARTHPACPHGWYNLLTLTNLLNDRLQAALSPAELAEATAHGREAAFGDIVTGVLPLLQAAAEPLTF